MMNGRNIFPFTASQWEELEHQALIFKYMVSGIPIPPELLFTIKGSSCLECSFSSRLFSHQPQHVGWDCFEMRLGRKVDPEPGRCRRTDGKKWRCSKEAYPDSKYCERHMHRGKNRSRKPVEAITATTMPNPSTATANVSSITKTHPSPMSLSLSSSFETQKHQHELRYPCYHSQVNDPFMYPSSMSLSLSSSSETQQHHHEHRYPGYHSQVNDPFMYPHVSGAPGVDSSSYSQSNKDYRLKEEVDHEHAFFSEPSGSGTTRSFSGSTVDDSWQLTPLKMSSSSSKQRNCSGSRSEYSYLELQSLTDHNNLKQNKQEDDELCYVLGSDIKCEMPVKLEKGEPQKKTVHRFFDEWPPKHRDSWLDLDDKSSNSSSVSTSRWLSIH